MVGQDSDTPISGTPKFEKWHTKCQVPCVYILTLGQQHDNVFKLISDKIN